MIKLPLVKTGQIALLICSLIFSVIPTIFIVLRLVARRIAKRRLDAADYFIMAAWVCFLFYFVFSAYGPSPFFMLAQRRRSSANANTFFSFPSLVDDGGAGHQHHSFSILWGLWMASNGGH